MLAELQFSCHLFDTSMKRSQNLSLYLQDGLQTNQVKCHEEGLISPCSLKFITTKTVLLHKPQCTLGVIKHDENIATSLQKPALNIDGEAEKHALAHLIHSSLSTSMHRVTGGIIKTIIANDRFNPTQAAAEGLTKMKRKPHFLGHLLFCSSSIFFFTLSSMTHFLIIS